MKRFIVAVVAIISVSVSCVANAQVATAPGQNKLQCFDGTTDGGFGGKCTLNSNGAKGPATLDNTDTNASGDYAGVYIQNTNLSGQAITAITQLRYQYSGNIAPNPGNLSLNVPIHAGPATDFYAFIDAFYCPGVDGKVDVINDPACGIYAGGVTFYPNWAAFVAAYPGATVAVGALPFVIAERTPAEPSALWRVTNVTLGKPGK